MLSSPAEADVRTVPNEPASRPARTPLGSAVVKAITPPMAAEPQSEACGPDSTSIRRDEERTLDRLMSALPEEHREVLVLRELEEMDYREIAAVTNVPIGTVMSRISRGRRLLHERLLALDVGRSSEPRIRR